MGGKRVKIDTDVQPKKKKRGKRRFVLDDYDRISQLPDDIIVDILSLLSIKEAARTSVLSSRWMNLWKHTHSLDFDAQSALRAKLEESPDRCKLLKSERRKHVKWVNSVLRSHKSPTLKEFKIHFYLDRSDSNSINRWLEFASSRQVERLELHFLFYHKNLYEYFGPSRETPVLFSKLQPPSDRFKSLKALSLKKVNVSGGAIEFFLHNCPLLEQLIVHFPGEIPKLEVCGSSLVLKHLEIFHCRGLESLKISAPSLTSLKVWWTSLEGLLLENVPMLVDVSVSFDEEDSISLKRLLSVLPCYISQLETLELAMWMDHVRQETDELFKFSEMPKLKKLVIGYGPWFDESLIRLASLARACPYLEEFVLKKAWSKRWRKLIQDDDVFDDDDDAIITFRHEHLQVFKLCGYYGSTDDDALVAYILENCVALEKIIIDPSLINYIGKLRKIDVEEAARKNAKQHLQPQWPQHVELVIR